MCVRAYVHKHSPRFLELTLPAPRLNLFALHLLSAVVILVPRTYNPNLLPGDAGDAAGGGRCARRAKTASASTASVNKSEKNTPASPCRRRKLFRSNHLCFLSIQFMPRTCRRCCVQAKFRVVGLQRAGI